MKKERTTFSQPLRVGGGKRVLIVYGQPDGVSLRHDMPYSSASCKRLFGDLMGAGLAFTDVQQYCVLHERILVKDGDTVFQLAKQQLAETPVDHTAESYVWFKGVYMLEHYHKYVELLKHVLQTVKPNIIIAADKWALFFLSGAEIDYRSIIKSDTGVTGTWRGSHMQLSQYFTDDGEASWPHVMVPIISVADLFAVNNNWHTHKLDMQRIGGMYTNLRNGEFGRSITREERFLLPSPDHGDAAFYEVCMKFLAEVATRLALCPDCEKIPLSVDIEHRKRPVYIDCIGIATSAADAITIPLYNKRGQSYWLLPSQEEELFWALKFVLEHPKAAIIGQNFNYDSFWFRENFCLNVRCTYDTMTLHHTLVPALEKNLGFLSSLYCYHHLYWKNELEDTAASTDMERWQYNCKDTTRTYEVWETLLGHWEEIRKGNPKQYSAMQFQMHRLHPAVRLVADRGFQVNLAPRQHIANELTDAIAKLDAQWNVIAGDISSSSPKQLGYFLYIDLGLPVPKVSKWSEGKYPTSEEAINALIEEFPLLTPVLQLLLDVRSLRVFLKTFIEARLSADGKMRTQYNIDGTDTFRFSSRKLPDETGSNLQNWPKGGKTSTGIPLPNVRKLLVPPPGYGVFDTDYDSADLRIVVAESGCKEMQHWLDTGQKPYIMVAREYHKDNSIDKYHPAYKLFKAYCHGSNYMGSASGLAKRMGLLVHESEKLQKWYFEKFPEIRLWHKRIKGQVDGRRYVENCFGYRFMFYDLSRHTIYQQACAWIPQSTVACMVNRSLVSITENENPNDLRVVLQVHDSLAGLYRLDLPDPKTQLRKHMEVPLPYMGKQIVVPADAMLSEISWGDCG